MLTRIPGLNFFGEREQVTRLNQEVLFLLNLLLDLRLGSIFSHTELLTYEILYPMMLNISKIH